MLLYYMFTTGIQMALLMYSMLYLFESQTILVKFIPPTSHCTTYMLYLGLFALVFPFHSQLPPHHSVPL